MPKIIEELREKILRVAQHKLFAEGYGKVSLRAIAGECGIAVGTIYNYFKDKDTLIATIMLEDWAVALREMDAGCAAANTAAAGFAAIYAALERFAQRYREVWSQFSQAGGSAGVVDSRHLMLRGQIAQRIGVLLARFDGDGALAPLLAETVLAAAVQPDIGPAQITALADRLFSHTDT